MAPNTFAPKFHLLIDTCVWLDLAKDYQQRAILTAFEELVRQGDIALILPRIIVDEFARNRARIIEDGSRSFSIGLATWCRKIQRFRLRVRMMNSSLSGTLLLMRRSLLSYLPSCAPMPRMRTEVSGPPLTWGESK
jgi:hypothetical protein